MSVAITRLFALLLLILASPSLVAEQYYKWVDDEGVTHYSADKPKGKEARKVRADNPPSSSQDQALKRLEQQRQQSQQERVSADDEDTGNGDKVSDKKKKEKCEQHRKNLKVLNNKPTVRRKNPETGEMEVLNQKQRQKMIKKTKKELKRCNESQKQNN